MKRSRRLDHIAKILDGLPCAQCGRLTTEPSSTGLSIDPTSPKGRLANEIWAQLVARAGSGLTCKRCGRPPDNSFFIQFGTSDELRTLERILAECLDEGLQAEGGRVRK